MLQKNYFLISALFGFFWPKLTKNEGNWQNPNRSMKFSEIWNVDSFQQKKMLQKKYFSFSAFFWPFLAIKQLKLSKRKKIGKIQTVYEIF